MTTIAQTALAFWQHRSAHCHNAYTDGEKYTLHNTVIAWHEDGKILGTYGGWKTPTTYNHLKAIAQACAGNYPPPYGEYADTDPTATFRIK